MKIVYPPNCREVGENLGGDELIRRLKALAHTFQTLGQEEGKYKELIPLAHHLADDFFLNHNSKDVQLLVACCIADILRIFAPEAPYVDTEEIKNVFYFLIRQLNGLKDPKDPAFKRYFYLLENLAYVKSFNMCFELPDDSQQLFCKLFQTFFSIISDEHSHKVRNYMLEVMHPLIAESDQISDELLNVVMKNIIEETKVTRNAHTLAKELVQKTSTVLQPFVQSFFNRELLSDKGSDDSKKLLISQRLYDFIYCLNSICPDVLMSVVPQLEYKLRSSEEKDRFGAVSLLARMFSEKGSRLAHDHRQLWLTFLGRFNDIKPQIRTKCVQYSMHFLLNHPELRNDLIDVLKARQHDTDESVRYEVVTAIVSTARRDFEIVAESPDLLSFVKERTLDKKFKIRREAVSGLAFIYKKRTINGTGVNPHGLDQNDSLAWIKNKILYGYYMNVIEDRLLVERLLNTTLVPYQLAAEDRMKMMLSLAATIDDKAEKAFVEILKNRAQVRKLVYNLLQVYGNSNLTANQKENELRIHVISLSKNLPDEIKAREFLMKFVHHMEDDASLLQKMFVIADPNVSCRECAETVNVVLKKLGQPIMTNLYYNTVKSLLERASSVLVDEEAVRILLYYVQDLLRGLEMGTAVADLDVDPSVCCTKGLRLLHLLATTQPSCFMNKDTLELLFELMQSGSVGEADEEVHSLVLAIFSVLGKHMPIAGVSQSLFDKLLEFALANVSHGTPKVAKHSIRAILANSNDDKSIDQKLLERIEEIKGNLDVDNEFCRTALSAIGHIALLAPDRFPVQIKNIISKKVVKELLMKQRKPTLPTSEQWCPEEELPEETRCKLEGLKVIGRWLVGLKDEKIMAKKTFRMLDAFIVNNGDLNLNPEFKLSDAEKAWLRVSAGACMLKICQQKGVGDEFNAEQFYHLSRLVADPVFEVRDIFLQKLHKGLSAGIPNHCLPLDFMGFYALCGLESNRALRQMAKQHMLLNVHKRRDYIKSLLLHGGDRANEQLPHVLPDFVLVFGVPVLAHSTSFLDPTSEEELLRMRHCLWFILEPVVTKNENFCFPFIKNLVDVMKMRVDAVDPTNEKTNHKLWALCDLALSLVVSKTTNYETKEHLTEPRVPEIYFRTPATSLEGNVTKPYLPEAVRMAALKKPTVVGKVLPERDGRVVGTGSGTASSTLASAGEDGVGDPAEHLERVARADGGRTVLRTLRDKDALGSEDEDEEEDDDENDVKMAAPESRRPTRNAAKRPAPGSNSIDDDSAEDPLSPQSPSRRYSRDPSRTYRTEERVITLDEFGGGGGGGLSEASNDVDEEEDEDEEDGEAEAEVPAAAAPAWRRPAAVRPTRSGRGAVGAPAEAKPTRGAGRRGAASGSKPVAETNGKKPRLEPAGTRAAGAGSVARGGGGGRGRGRGGRRGASASARVGGGAVAVEERASEEEEEEAEEEAEAMEEGEEEEAGDENGGAGQPSVPPRTTGRQRKPAPSKDLPQAATRSTRLRR